MHDHITIYDFIETWFCSSFLVVVGDVNKLKNGRKPVKLQKKCPAGCAREGKQSKGN